MLRFVLAFALVATLFGLLEHLYRRTWPPEEPESADAERRFGLRRDTRTDLLYTLFTPLVTRSITLVGLIIAVLLLARAQGIDLQLGDGVAAREALAPFFADAPVSAQPLWLQGIEVALLLDLSSYWIHRLFHRGRLWPFHAIHHSSRRLTWLSSVRLHPINDLLTRVLQVIALLLIGFDPTLLAALVPFTGLYAILLHARVPWDFGPLRYVIASPVFHRWHHTSAAAGRDKNFAGFFPVWDLIFGTFYMPGDPPTTFGVDEAVPVTFFQQLTWPFRQASRDPASSADNAASTANIAAATTSAEATAPRVEAPPP